MSRVKLRTVPDLSKSSDIHQAATLADHAHYRAWQYNVADQFKGSTVDEIKKSLQATANPFAVCFEHWIGDFNMGSGIRNANAFNAREVFYLGDKKWDRRSAVGVYNYTSVTWLSTIDEFLNLREKYTIIGVDNIPGKSVPLTNFKWPPNTLMVFGEEGVGLTPKMQELCSSIVEIEMYGSVRSLNCGVASGIVMHDLVNKYKTK